MLHEFADIIDPSTLPAKLTQLKWQITGFIDGNGSFPVILSPIPNKKFGWLIQPRFQVKLKKSTDTLTMLQIIRRTIGLTSQILEANGHLKLITTNRRLLLEKVIPFFTKYRLALKQDEFNLMRYVTEALENKKHLQYNGFREIIRYIFTSPIDGVTARKWAYNQVIPGEPQPTQAKPTPPKFPTGKELRYYIAGFIDAEASLGYTIQKKTKSITPYLTVTHSQTEILTKIQQTLQCGNISTGRLQIYGTKNITRNVIKFLQKHPPIAQRTQYQEFKKILSLITGKTSTK